MADDPLIQKMQPAQISEDGQFATISFKIDGDQIVTLRCYAEALDSIIVDLERAAHDARNRRVAQGHTEPSPRFPYLGVLIVPDDFQVIQDQLTKESRLVMNRKGRYQLQIRLDDRARQGLKDAFVGSPQPIRRATKH